ncbi:hypothetical protein HPB51_025772 [Rhipicephalus microplus]|uniref:E3 ubiquitin ligase UBR4 C-terminal domain-containing protein n=1 Tax=Rhipicephalus microplus TaxID=6941 RepID=A0A9J6EJS1_RHIMP|nr:hypothetical protein HPB51_025772 [Rhipicephalus microplus]
MRVVYRMRGLLGDATEEFVESLEAKAGGPQVDEEHVYRLARVMGICGGLEAMLERLAAIDDLSRGRPLLTVLLKLFGLCVKVQSNRLHLLEPSLHAVARLLGALRLLLGAQEAALAEQLLATLEAVLAEGAAHVPPQLPEGVTRDDITFLLTQVGTGRPSPRLLQLLMRVVPFLTLTDETSRADDDIVSCAEATDDEILRQVVPEPESGSDDDNNDRPQPSEIANAVTILSSVYGDDVTLAQIRANQIASKRSLRQGSIKDFFKPA